MMKAQVLYGIGNIKYAELDKPVPKKGEALVKVIVDLGSQDPSPFMLSFLFFNLVDRYKQ